MKTHAKRQKLLKLYDKIVLTNPKYFIIFFFSILLFFAFWMKEFRLDASSESLILQSDPSLRFHQSIVSRYGSKKFLIVTYSPKDKNLLTKESFQVIRTLSDSFKKIPHVSSVLTILDVPLFNSPKQSITDLKNKKITLESDEVNLEQAKMELKNSPLYTDQLISADLSTAAIQINFDQTDEYIKVKSRWSELLDKQNIAPLSEQESLELEQLNLKYSEQKEVEKNYFKTAIKNIRTILTPYQLNADIHLGGVPMIADDMVELIKSDLKLFGSIIFVLIILVLSFIFRRIPWIALPVECCIFSIIIMVGVNGLFGWKVTVISSNFISLQIIFTMALAIHLIIRFNELLKHTPNASLNVLVRKMVHSIFEPCLYTALTTVAGFYSLMFCDIAPVVDFGWMMSLGITISFIVTFFFFPARLMLYKETPKLIKSKFHHSTKSILASFTNKHGDLVIIVSVLFFIITIFGIFRLRVENSFIDYFKKNTEIYQGMKFIDQHLGGTTPLDIIINFPDTLSEETDKENISDNEEEYDEDLDDLDDLLDEYEEEETSPEDKEIYWFTAYKMDTLKKIHNYLEGLPASGKVSSLDTFIAVIKDILNKENLTSLDFALIFKNIPEDLKKSIIYPFVSVENNQTRISVRVKDSLKGLRRNSLINKIKGDLSTEFKLDKESFKLTNLLVLYNNMLQSLFSSQIKTLGFTILILMIMFIVLFRSLKLSVIAIIPNLFACLSVLGIMGIFNISLDMMTITIVSISIGIAVDNTIHYIHRFEKEFKKEKSYQKTMFLCHSTIGKAMTYTSIIITIGFSILALSNFIPCILFGLLTGLTMIIALTASLTLLPKLILMIKPFGKESLPID